MGVLVARLADSSDLSTLCKFKLKPDRGFRKPGRRRKTGAMDQEVHVDERKRANWNETFLVSLPRAASAGIARATSEQTA